MTQHAWSVGRLKVEDRDGNRFYRTVQRCRGCGAVIPIPGRPSLAACQEWNIDLDCDVELVGGIMGA